MNIASGIGPLKSCGKRIYNKYPVLDKGVQQLQAYGKKQLEKHPGLNQMAGRVAAMYDLGRCLYNLPTEDIKIFTQFIKNNMDVLAGIARHPRLRSLILTAIAYGEVSHEAPSVLRFVEYLEGKTAENLQPFIEDPKMWKAFWGSVKLAKNVIARLNNTYMEGIEAPGKHEAEKLVKDAVDIFTGIWRSGLTCVINNKVGEAAVLVGEKRFSGVLFNLLLNSTQHYNYRKGVSLQMEITISKEGEEWVKFEFKDNGQGFGPEVKAKIGYPGFTTKETKGTGLGIYMAKKVITDYKGEFSIDSPGEGKGCVVTILLPAVLPR